MTLEDGANGDILRCLLEEVDLDRIDSAFQYDAVSYTWSKSLFMAPGEIVFRALFVPKTLRPFYTVPGRSRVVVCNGKLLRIQENLYNFLVRLRQKGQNRPLWIDAICIDQGSSDDVQAEKRTQVRLMGRIYSSAASVLVWLGEYPVKSAFSKERLDMLPHLQLEVKNSRTGHPIQAQLQRSSKFNPCDKLCYSPPFNGRINWATLKLAHSTAMACRVAYEEYFKRSWVVQELILARELRFFVASIELSLHDIERIFNWLVAFSRKEGMALYTMGDSDTIESFLDAIKSRDDYNHTGPWSLQDYVALCRDRKASRPEDKVFAILGLVNQEVRSRLLTDKVKSVAQVYTDCTLVLVQQTSWVHVLSLIGKVCEGEKSIPSWIPDYSVSLRPKPFWYYGCAGFHAASSLPPSFRLLESGNPSESSSQMLQLSAAHIDNVVQIGESSMMFRSLDSLRIQGYILDLANSVGKHYPPTGELTMIVLLNTLTAGLFTQFDVDTIELRRGFIEWLDHVFVRVAEWRSNYLFRKLLQHEYQVMSTKGR